MWIDLEADIAELFRQDREGYAALDPEVPLRITGKRKRTRRPLSASEKRKAYKAAWQRKYYENNRKKETLRKRKRVAA